MENIQTVTANGTEVTIGDYFQHHGTFYMVSKVDNHPTAPEKYSVLRLEGYKPHEWITVQR